MILLKLGIILLIIIITLKLKKPLYLAILLGILGVIVLFKIDPKTAFNTAIKGATAKGTLIVVGMLYLITYLQKMLEKRKQLHGAQEDLNNIFNNRRINASLAPIFIGLLPSAAAINICADIVEDASDNYLQDDEKAFVTSYFRHIPESFLPTYSSVILLSQISGLPLAPFVLGSIPLVISLYVIGYLFYLKKIPKETGQTVTQNKRKSLLSLFLHLWSLFLIVFLILVFRIEVYIAVGISIILCIFIYKFKPSELIPMIKSSFESKMLLNSWLVMIFKEFIVHSGAVEELPKALINVPIPQYILFALIFFIGSLLAGNNAIVAIGTTLAYTMIPDGGIPLMILLMSFAYAAMQLSPTHFCLFVAIDCFHTNFGALVRRTIKPIFVYCIISLIYYNLLRMIY